MLDGGAGLDAVWTSPIYHQPVPSGGTLGTEAGGAPGGGEWPEQGGLWFPNPSLPGLGAGKRVGGAVRKRGRGGAEPL